VRALRFPRLWIAVGWLLVAGLVASSLLPVPVEIPEVRYGDKLVHVVTYLLLMGWFAQIWSSRRALSAHAWFLVFLGVVLELLQGLTPARTPDAFDALANAGGVLLGWLMAFTPASGLLQRLEPGPRAATP